VLFTPWHAKISPHVRYDSTATFLEYTGNIGICLATEQAIDDRFILFFRVTSNWELAFARARDPRPDPSPNHLSISYRVMKR